MVLAKLALLILLSAALAPVKPYESAVLAASPGLMGLLLPIKGVLSYGVFAGVVLDRLLKPKESVVLTTSDGSIGGRFFITGVSVTGSTTLDVVAGSVLLFLLYPNESAMLPKAETTDAPVDV